MPSFRSLFSLEMPIDFDRRVVFFFLVPSSRADFSVDFCGFNIIFCYINSAKELKRNPSAWKLHFCSCVISSMLVFPCSMLSCSPCSPLAYGRRHSLCGSPYLWMAYSASPLCCLSLFDSGMVSLREAVTVVPFRYLRWHLWLLSWGATLA